MERNRRIAKAYARSTTITVNGSKDEYLDGTTLGLNSFDNPDRDSKTSYIKRYIGEGIKIRIHHSGDIFVKRLSKSSVFTHHFSLSDIRPGSMKTSRIQEDSSGDVYGHLHSRHNGAELYGIVGSHRQPPIGGGGGSAIDLATKGGGFARSRNKNLGPNKSSLALSSSLSSSSASSSSTSMLASASSGGPTAASCDRQKQPNALQANKVVRLFNMKEFKEALEFESRQAVPNRARLQSMCISIISFILDDRKLLNLPSWIMIINIVAIDLLSSEIGLVGPYDIGLSAPPLVPAIGRGQSDRSSRQRVGQVNSTPIRNKSFDRSYTHSNVDKLVTNHDDSHDYDYSNLNDDNDNADVDTYGGHGDIDSFTKPFNGLSSKNKLCLDNGNSKSDRFMLSRRAFFGDREQQRTQLDVGGGGVTKDNSMRYFRHQIEQNMTDTCNNEFKFVPNDTGAHELMGSSSSGFNSNCSLQNDDSSPASSNSNIALNSDLCQNEANKDSSSSSCGSETKITDKPPVKKTSRLKRMFKKSDGAGAAAATTTSTTGSENVSLGPALMGSRAGEEANLRGKRAPKLAHHGLATPYEQVAATIDECGHKSDPNDDDDEPIIMSDPIPIPAPPTSAGGPSGKANLILVSPTGLSPPSVKRHSGLMSKIDGQRHHQEFSSIKHIDNNGRCKVLMDKTCAQNQQQQQLQQSKKPLKLPTGIPPHAQLAPPATQMHILRYLMSKTKTNQMGGGGQASGGDLHNQQARPVLPMRPPGRRLQRPLPVLPCHQGRQDKPQIAAKLPRSDESLYYSGLQARVPNYHHQAQHVPAVRQMLPSYPTNRSAIDALLTDFKRSAHFRQQQRKCLLTSMRSNSASQLAEQAEANKLPHINYYPGHTTAANNGKQSVSDGGKEYALTSLDSLSKQYGEHSQLQRDLGQSFRRSLDSLNRLSTTSGSDRKPLASFLNHVGGFLKRSKTKGSTPVLVSTEM